MARVKRHAGKAIDMSRFPFAEVLAAARSTATRVFHGFWGRSLGKLLGGYSVPWKGSTIGISGFEAKIAAVKAVNATVGAKNEAFGRAMMAHHEKGIVVVVGKKGYAIINAAAAAKAGLTPISPVFVHGWEMKRWLRTRPEIKEALVAYA